MKPLAEKEALSKAAAYCSRSEHCRADVLAKLKQWGMDEASCGSIIAYLEKEKFIDESRYCRVFINDKLRFAKWGRYKIAQALRMKNISGQVSKACLNDIDGEEYLAILKEVIRSKKKTLPAGNQYEVNRKLAAFALGRGFEMEYIRQVISVSEE